ncbi:MAG: cytochrome c peroxidase [Bacteroidota bacterium]
MRRLSLFNAFLLCLLIACQKGPDLPEPYLLVEPAEVIKMQIPEDNPLTKEGIALGRKLFYDPILSLDSTQSCATCHQQHLAFTDGLAHSLGVLGEAGERSSISLVNVGYRYKGLFWDGRVQTLEEQSLHPVRNSKELAANWQIIEKRIQSNAAYVVDFKAAFLINRVNDIDSFLVAKALAQFERTITGFDAKFDRVQRGAESFTASEKRGWTIFFDASLDVPHAECNHCHVDPLFTNLEFHNNGIQAVDGLEDFQDKGRGAHTSNRYDNGKFRVSTLRNITLTAPYMHDGSIKTLAEVLDHYNSGGHFAENVSPNVRQLALNDVDKADLLAFLNTLTDSTLLNNPNLSNPFLQ